MIYGYARVSTIRQAKDGNSLNRFARSIMQGSQLINDLIQKRIKVYILNIGILDNSPSSKLIRNIFFSFAEFERDMIVERTQEGKRAAREKENYHDGRPKKYSQVADMTGISKATLYQEHIKSKTQ